MRILFYSVLKSTKPRRGWKPKLVSGKLVAYLAKNALPENTASGARRLLGIYLQPVPSLANCWAVDGVQHLPGYQCCNIDDTRLRRFQLE
jgi:hypothetical protein